jgi:hypothetical protein
MFAFIRAFSPSQSFSSLGSLRWHAFAAPLFLHLQRAHALITRPSTPQPTLNPHQRIHTQHAHSLGCALQVGYIGIPLAVISLIYLVTFGYWVLPDTGAGMLGQVHSSRARCSVSVHDNKLSSVAGASQLRSVCH